MKKLIHLVLIFTCVFFCSVSLSANDIPAKPTREQVFQFLEDYQSRYPLTEEEKQIDRHKRSEVNLIEHLGNDFSGLDLSGMNLKNLERPVILVGADFSGCNLRETIFYGGDLTNTDFSDADMTDAKFWFCDVKNADFTWSILVRTEFAYCEMENIRMDGLDVRTTSWTSSHLSGASMKGTDFTGISFQHYKDFKNADLSHANFKNCKLSYAEFQGANLKYVNFTNADLHNADFTDADIEGADFTDADIQAANFSESVGIEDLQRKELEKRSGRWWYDFKQAFYAFLVAIYYPTYIAVAVSVILFSIIGILMTRKKKSLKFDIAVSLNVFAFFSTGSTFWMMFSGGHPIRQMSQGNYNAWSFWLNFFPFPLFGLMISILVCGIMSLLTLNDLVYSRSEHRSWRLFLYLVLTLIHGLIAFNWLIMFMPDA